LVRYFLDTSALLKRYVVEQSTDYIRRIVVPEAGHVVFIAQITPVEIMSAIARQRREGVISDEAASTLRVLIDRHVGREYEVARLSNRITNQAMNLLSLHSLRAYDAIQLASALDVNARLVAAGLPPLMFVCADKRLIEAARKEGLIVEEPA